MVSQFVISPEDVVFAIEYSICVAQTVVYQWLGIDAMLESLHWRRRAKQAGFWWRTREL